jgi:serralysin
MASTTTPIATGDNNIDALLKKYKWASNTVTFSFTSNADDYADYRNISNAKDYPLSHQALNTGQQSVVRDWLNQYASVSLLKPVELTGSGDRNATIRIGMSNKPATGDTFTPSTVTSGGDIWLNPAKFNTFNGMNYPEMGNYAYHGIGHEIGHAFGLKHGHATDPDEQLRDVVLSYDRDSMEFSIMTYRSYVGGPTTYLNERGGYAQSLMMYDIRAIQQMYGANFGYNAGDTTYSFTDSAGELQINGIGQGKPIDSRIFRTIWDGGGTDTYNFSNFFTDQLIDLTPGGWSDLALGTNNYRARLSSDRYARGHVFNALQYNGDLRSLIENAVGGSGNDIIRGNTVGNILNGRGGNDRIYNVTSNSAIKRHDITLGDSGNDTIFDMDSIDGDFHDGGAGIDWIDYSNYDFGATPSVIDLTTSKFTVGTLFETINNFENASGTRGSETIIGSSVNNVLQGNDGDDTLQGNGGNDILLGNAGVDFLNGGTGNDAMDGGSGNDTYVVDNLGDTVIEQLSNDIDTVVSYVNNYTLGANVENLTLADGSSAINGTGNTLNNSIQGNAANNILSGLEGNDFILDDKGGTDTLNGGAGNDVLLGYAGVDTLNGGTEDDELSGGTGSDTLTGGAGNDRFHFNNSLDGIDTITDFVVADDVIHVEKVGFVGGLIRGFLTADQFRTGTTAQDDSDRFIYNRTTGALSFDSDGVGGLAQTQFAKLSTGLAMTNQDIYVTSIGI